MGNTCAMVVHNNAIQLLRINAILLSPFHGHYYHCRVGSALDVNRLLKMIHSINVLMGDVIVCML